MELVFSRGPIMGLGFFKFVCLFQVLISKIIHIFKAIHCHNCLVSLLPCTIGHSLFWSVISNNDTEKRYYKCCPNFSVAFCNSLTFTWMWMSSYLWYWWFCQYQYDLRKRYVFNKIFVSQLTVLWRHSQCIERESENTQYNKWLLSQLQLLYSETVV